MFEVLIYVAAEERAAYVHMDDVVDTIAVEQQAGRAVQGFTPSAHTAAVMERAVADRLSWDVTARDFGADHQQAKQAKATYVHVLLLAAELLRLDGVPEHLAGPYAGHAINAKADRRGSISPKEAGL